jgi:hypothetical protein
VLNDGKARTRRSMDPVEVAEEESLEDALESALDGPAV